MRGLIICTPSQILLEKKYEIGRACSMSGREVHTKFWEENLKEKRPLGRPVPRWEGNNKMYFKK
jgi:hypothetical protein